MSLKRPKISDVCCDVRYCVQLNHDEMLFFDDYSKMKRYIYDYYRRIPVFQSSMFVVRFYDIK